MLAEDTDEFHYAIAHSGLLIEKRSEHEDGGYERAAYRPTATVGHFRSNDRAAFDQREFSRMPSNPRQLDLMRSDKRPNSSPASQAVI